MPYMIFLFDDAPEDLREKVLKVDPTAYTEYAPRAYLLRFGGTAKALWERLGFVAGSEQPTGIVASVDDHFGFAKRDIWSWLSHSK